MTRRFGSLLGVCQAALLGAAVLAAPAAAADIAGPASYHEVEGPQAGMSGLASADGRDLVGGTLAMIADLEGA